MDARALARLRILLQNYPTVWHAGRTVGRTLYTGDGPDDLIGIVDTRALAELVVLLHAYGCEQLLLEEPA
jgi:hypothetical protein